MSQGKESAATLLSTLKAQKSNLTRSGRPTTSRYAADEGAQVGRGGGRGGGDVEHPPSASGDVDSELPSASGDVASQNQLEVEDEVEVEVEAAPKRKKMRGEAGVPEEKYWPTTEEAKTLIEPHGVE